jgi:hypothetical protein
MKTTLVHFRHGDLDRPVLKVEERDEPNDVTIVFRTERDEHLSLHRMDDGILLTHYSPDMACSVHDEARVRAARAAGWNDPERHGNYVAHWMIWPRVLGMDGHYLVGRRITINRAKPTAKYEAVPRITIDAPAPEFMVTIILATPEQPYSKYEEPHVETSFGHLFFRPERP